MLNAGELLAGLQAEACIKVGEGLIEEKHRRHLHKGAGDGDALLLAAGELLRTALRELVNLHELRDLHGLVAHLLLRKLLAAAQVSEREHDVVENGQVRVERVVLEYQTDAAVLGGDVGDVRFAEVDAAGGGHLQSAD